MQTHELKIWPMFFEPLATGKKTFELRKEDRGFMVGDTLLLREWSEQGGYSGREIKKCVTFMLAGCWGVENGYVCMALGDLPSNV